MPEIADRPALIVWGHEGLRLSRIRARGKALSSSIPASQERFCCPEPSHLSRKTPEVQD